MWDKAEIISAIAFFITTIGLSVKIWAERNRPKKHIQTERCSKHSSIETTLDTISEDLRDIKKQLQDIISLQLHQQETIGFLSGKINNRPGGN